jgi:histidinol-phosphate aminotransferase
VANFVFAETGGDANDLFQRLLREGVIVRPLQGFGAPTAIRVSVGTPDELDALSSALDRVLMRA